MKINFKTFGRRSAIILAESLAAVLVLAVIVLGVGVWRLSSGPVDMEFARDYIENALRDPERGIYSTMDKIVLHWPNLKGPLLLGVQNGELHGADGEVIISIDEAAIGISKARLLLGQVAPVALILKKPVLRAVRTKDGRIDVGFGAPMGPFSKEQEEKVEDQTNFMARVLRYIARPGAEKSESSSLASLESFEIEEAKVLVEDYVLNTSWMLERVDASFQSAREGLQALLFIALPGSEEASLEAGFIYNWDTEEISVGARAQNFDMALLVNKVPALSDFHYQKFIFDADIDMKLGPDFMPRSGHVQVSSGHGQITSSELSSEPVAFKDMQVDAVLDAESGVLEVTKAQVTANETTVQAQAKLNVSDVSVAGPIKLSIDRLPQKDIASLWPAALKGDSSEEWIVQKMSEGVFTDLYAALDLDLKKGEEGWDFDAKNVEAGFAFEDMRVDYRPPMLPVTKAKGKGTFNLDEEKLVVDIESAAIQDLKVTGAHLEFADIIKVGAGKADIDVKIEGPLKTMFEYVGKEPIELEHDFDISKIKGDVSGDVNVKFPTTKDIRVEDVKVSVNGEMNNITLPNVVKDLPLTGGPFKVKVAGNDFSVKGSGKLASRPVTLEYNEFISSKGQPYTSKVTASLPVDPDLRAHFGINISDFVEGTAEATVTYTKFDDVRSEASVSTDLTNAQVMIDPADYKKMPGQAGNATMTAHFKNEILQEISDFKATAPGLSLEKGALFFRQQNGETELAQGLFGHMVVRESVGKMEFEVAPSGNMKITMNGPFLDIRPFLADKDEEEKKSYDNPAMKVYVSADTMRTADEETIQYGKIYVDIDDEGRINQMEMDAIVGKGDVYLRYKPDASGKRVFRFEADDAGATLRAFDLYDKIEGGRMVVYGEPIKGVFDRNLIGLAEITDFKAVRTPVLARLLGALSLTGMLGILNDEGLNFTKLEANFDWKYRPEGSLLVLKDGRTSGNSLGLTFDGTFDRAINMIDVSGTIVPMSGINSIIGSIPLLGDILTGGSGGVFAATYTIKGQGKEPDVWVNPLSVLAPGIIRRILFEQN